MLGKKPRKPSRKSLRAKLDKLVSEIVRLRDGKCVLCGSTFHLQCGHLFTRTNLSTRWDLGNCFAQCAGCNIRHEHDPWPFYKWYIGRYGQEAFDKLYEKHKTITPLKDYQLIELYEQLSNDK